MEYFVQQLINGITLGSIYGLIAIGYTMVYGIIGMINFAHGDVFMVRRFIALIAFLLLAAWLGISSVRAARLLIVLVVAMALTALLRLDHRAHRLPAAAPLFPPGAAHFRHRHIDRAAELRPGCQGARVKPLPPLVARRLSRCLDQAAIRGHGCPTCKSSSWS